MFKILSLAVVDHPVLKNMEIDFTDNAEKKTGKYVSLIIGENGTGKTQIIKCLIDILIVLNDPMLKWEEPYNFTIIIFKDNNEITFSSNLRTINTNKAVANSGDILPNKLLISAYTFNDQYPKIDDNKIYYYGGLKTTTNNIFINNPSQSTFNNLCKIIQAETEIGLLDNIFKELKFKTRIQVIYGKRRYYSLIQDKKLLKIVNAFSNEEMTDEARTKGIEAAKAIIESKLRINDKNRSKRYQDDAIKRFLNSNDSIGAFLTFLAKNVQIDEGGKSKLDFAFEYSWGLEPINQQINLKFKEHLVFYKVLSDLDILSFESFHVFKSQFFSFSNASSGEFHFLHLVLGLLANIEKDSLVLIDEPEISLHVNWQNKFFHLIKPIIEKYKSCQFVIASHSHFLVSELDSKNSAIITLKRNNNDEVVIRNIQEDGINTLGWSAEQILFEVFEMATDRNYYLSLLVEEIVSEMSVSNPNNERIEKNRALLKQYDLSNLNIKDPFNTIIKNIIGDEVA